MSPIPEQIQTHVPAWKKLGLKLKFAKEEPEDIQPGQNGIVNPKKRKIPAEEEAVAENSLVERSAKKAKKSKLRAKKTEEVNHSNGTSHNHQNEDGLINGIKTSESSITESAEAINGNQTPSDKPTNGERPSKKTKRSKVRTDVSVPSVKSGVDGTNVQESSPPPALKVTPASKGKSVSFTPDTKTSDGDSVKSLYKTWIAKQVATDPSFDPSTVSPVLRSIVPSAVALAESPSAITSTSTSKSDPSTKDKKKSPKKTKTRLPKTPSDAGPSRFDPVLTYLTTYHTSPQTWKFSKPHQNQILKHLLSPTHIPPSHDRALIPYIRGLKGASARSRIRKAALAVRDEDEQWLASESSGSERMENETAAQCNARRRRDYEAAVARAKQALEEREDEREDRESELLGEKAEWEERYRKRKRAEIVLWGVGEEEERPALSSQQDAFDEANNNNNNNNNDQHHHQKTTTTTPNSGIAQLERAARDHAVPTTTTAPAARGRGTGSMGGVESIDAGGIAGMSRGKKVVFTDAQDAAEKGTRKRKRKRKMRETGVPDDDDDDDDSSSSSSEGGE